MCYWVTRLRGTVERHRFYDVHGQASQTVICTPDNSTVRTWWRRADKPSQEICPGGHCEPGKTQAADRIEQEQSKLMQRDITFTVWDETEGSSLLRIIRV